MKKIVSFFLTFLILFSCSATTFHCYAENDGALENVITTKKTFLKNADDDDEDSDTDDGYDVLGTDEDFDTDEGLNDVDKTALKKAILKLANDKKFTDQVIKNYTKSHELPTWLKIVKTSAKIVFFPVKVCLNAIKKAVDYTVGKKVTELIENKVLPTVIASLTGWSIYKKVPLVNKSINCVITFLKLQKLQNNEN